MSDIPNTVSSNRHNKHNDEIDLIELISNLWSEKVIIILSTMIITTMGIFYGFTIPPTYKVSAQLLPPLESELSKVNATGFFDIDSTQAFTYFLDTLESSDHIFNLAEKVGENNKTADPIQTVRNIRRIQYPNTSKKKNEIVPDIYTLSYKTTNREGAIKLLSYDLELATSKVMKNLNLQYLSNINKQINIIQNDQRSERRTLNKKLHIRQSYLTFAKQDEIKKLEEHLAIAKELNIKEPTSLMKLSGEDNNIHIITNIISSIQESTALTNTNTPEDKDPDNKGNIKKEKNDLEQTSFNQYVNHLSTMDYLRGERILTSEINKLKSLPKNVFLDNDITIINSQLDLLEVNPKLEQLKQLLTLEKNIEKITFFSNNIYSPENPIQSKRTLITIVSIILGGIIGFLIAFGRILYKKYQKPI